MAGLSFKSIDLNKTKRVQSQIETDQVHAAAALIDDIPNLGFHKVKAYTCNIYISLFERFKNLIFLEEIGQL